MVVNIQGQIVDDKGNPTGGSVDLTTGKPNTPPDYSGSYSGPNGAFVPNNPASYPITGSALSPSTPINYQTPSNVSVPPVTPLVAEPTTPKADAIGKIMEDIMKGQEELSGKTAYQLEQEQKYGLTADTLAQQKDIETQMNVLLQQQNSLKDEYNIQIPNKVIDEFTGRASVSDQGGITEAQRRKNLLAQGEVSYKWNGLAAQQAILTGKIGTAQIYIDQAMRAKYGQKEADLKTKIDNVNMLLKDPALTKEETDRANARLDKLTKEKNAQDAQIKNETDKWSVTTTAAQNAQNFTATPQYPTLATAFQAMNNAKTKEEALQIATATGLVTKPVTAENSYQIDLGNRVAIIDKATNKEIGSFAKGLTPKDLQGSGLNAESATAYMNQYASTGTLSGVPKEYVGIITAAAKELPQTEGAIVDNNTNVKSSKLSSTQTDAYSALRDLTKKLDEAKTLFAKLNTGLVGGTLGNIFPSADREAYNTLRGEIVDLLARARTGAAISVTEEALYKEKVPGTFNESLWIGQSGESKIDGLKKSLESKLDSALKASGVSMYGFSKIKIGDTEYKVGDVITVNGVSGRILPDGKIVIIK